MVSKPKLEEIKDKITELHKKVEKHLGAAEWTAEFFVAAKTEVSLLGFFIKDA